MAASGDAVAAIVADDGIAATSGLIGTSTTSNEQVAGADSVADRGADHYAVQLISGGEAIIEQASDGIA